MKFKIIFILFNVIVVFSLFMIVLMPVLMLGSEYGMLFFSSIWYVILLFAAVIGSVDAYFIYNWKLFRFLEEENWKGLVEYIEKRIGEEKVPSGFIARILINGYLSLADLEGVEKLGKRLKDKKPALYKKMILFFAVPVLLKGDPSAIEEFAAPYVGDRKVKDRLWISYLYAFALLLNKKNEDAAAVLYSLCREKLSPVHLLLVIYSFHPFADADGLECVEKKKKQLLDRYTKESFGLEIEKERSNIAVTVLSRIVDEAYIWLFDGNKITNKEK